MKSQLNEVQQLQKIAGLLNEKFEVVHGKKPSGDPGLIVKKDGVVLSNDDIDKLSASEQQEISDLKRNAAVIGGGKSTFKINAKDKPHSPDDEIDPYDSSSLEENDSYDRFDRKLQNLLVQMYEAGIKKEEVIGMLDGFSKKLKATGMI